MSVHKSVTRNTGSTPISLRLPALLAFATLFITLSACLFILWSLSRKLDGFDLVSNNHYTWVYGPTALLVLIIGFWRQIDYNCRILLPWQELALTGRPALNAIFLDYISPFQLVAIYRAARSGHFLVVLTGIGFLLLKLLTVVSTGLLSVAEVPVHISGYQLKTTNYFRYSVNTGDNPTVAGTSPVYHSYGYLVKNVSFMEGVTANAAYQSVALLPGDHSVNVTYGALVQALSPSMICHPINLQNVTEHSLNVFNMNVAQPCQLSASLKLSCDPSTTQCPPVIYELLAQPTDCGTNGEAWWVFSYSQWSVNQSLAASNHTSNITGGHQSSSSAMNTVRARQISSSSLDIKRGRQSSGTSLNSPRGRRSSFSSFKMDANSTWACKLDYDIAMVNVTYDTSVTPPDISVSSKAITSPQPHLAGFSAANLSSLVQGALQSSVSMFGNRNVVLEITKQMTNGGNDTFTKSPGLLGPALETLFKQFAAQTIVDVVLQPADTNIVGTLIQPHTRVLVSTVILILMVAGFLLMAAITAVVMLLRPLSVGPFQRADVIETIIEFVSRNSALSEVLEARTRRENPNKEADITYVRSQKRPRSLRLTGLGIAGKGKHDMILNYSRTPSAKEDTRREESLSAGQNVWWKPLTLRRSVLCMTMLTPLLLAVILELVQRQSDKNHGFVGINPATSSLAQSVYTRLFPALLMLLTATLFTSLEFNAAILAPFNSLLKNRLAHQRTNIRSIIGQMTPVSLLAAFEQKQWSAAVAMIAACIGSILTITVSGLLVIQSQAGGRAISMAQLDDFRLQWNTSLSDDGGAAIMLSMIESANFTYPMLTYDDLIFPNITIDNEKASLPINGSGLITMNVPALRANLACQEVPSSWKAWNQTYHTGAQTWFFTGAAEMTLEPECLKNWPHSNNTSVMIGAGGTFSGSAVPTFYFAQLTDACYNMTSETVCEDIPPGCPSVFYAYGWTDIIYQDPHGYILACNQQVQQVETELTLTYPGMNIFESRPPVPNEQSAITLLSTSESNDFPWKFDQTFDQSFSLFKPSVAYNAISNALVFDNFFTGALFGKEGYTFQNFYKLKTNDGQAGSMVQSLYRRYIAQVINAKLRVPRFDSSGLNYTTTRRMLNATIALDTGVLRIVQHRTPKLILQVMLGCMFILGCLSLQLGKFRKIVPLNPCSIAGVAILFTGSRLCKANLALRDPDASSSKSTRRASSTITEIEDADDEQVRERTPLMSSTNNKRTTIPPKVPPKDRQSHEIESKKTTSLWEAFARQDSSGRLSTHPEPSSKSHHTRIVELDDATDTAKDTTNSNIVVDLRTAELRLGWWRDDVFYGDRGPDARELRVQRETGRKEWRYGIDYIASSARSAARCHCGAHTCHV